MTSFLSNQINFLSEFLSESAGATWPVHWKTKFELMQKIRARNFLPVGLRVTNLGDQAPFSFNEIGFEFSYKRQGIAYKVPSAYLRSFSAPQSVPGTLLTPVFTTSGQAAISLALATVKGAFPSIEMSKGSLYFETKHCCDLLEIGFVSSADREHIAFWDGTEPWPGLISDRAVALVVDTTYFTYDEIPFAEISNLQKKIPVFFVRSHLKLDCLGAEYGTLGSLWISCPDSFPQKDFLHARIYDLARLWGCYADLESIYPFLTNLRFQEINQERNRRLKANGLKLKEALRDERVIHFEHGLFLFLESHSEKLNSALVQKILHLNGIENYNVDSFGFDFVAVKEFERNQRRLIRVTSADLNDQQVQRVGMSLSDCLRLS